jgi:hypothetical protein
MPDQNSTEEAWRVFGVLISRKIDVVAFAALFLSVGAVLVQLSAFFRGAELTLLPPDQVFIVRDDNYSDGKSRARFGTTLIYVNRGEKGYSQIVRREVAYIKGAGKDREQGWDSFVTFDGFKPQKPSPATPFAIDGGESKSHQTYFIPWPKHCPPSNTGCDVMENHIYWDDFIAELRRLVSQGNRHLQFRFAAEVIDGKPIPTSCSIDIDANIVSAIELYHGYNPTCFPDH